MLPEKPVSRGRAALLAFETKRQQAEGEKSPEKHSFSFGLD